MILPKAYERKNSGFGSHLAVWRGYFTLPATATAMKQMLWFALPNTKTKNEQ